MELLACLWGQIVLAVGWEFLGSWRRERIGAEGAGVDGSRLAHEVLGRVTGFLTGVQCGAKMRLAV